MLVYNKNIICTYMNHYVYIQLLLARIFCIYLYICVNIILFFVYA